MPSLIILLPFYHNAQECIALKFEDESLHRIVKTIRGIRWSQGRLQWYLPLSKENYQRIKLTLGGNAVIENIVLRKYLEERKLFLAVNKEENLSRQRAIILLQYPLSEENRRALLQFQQLIQLKGYL